jgi:Flp pilus assembly protein TadG
LGRNRHRDGERGAIVVEFAIVFPVLLLLVLGIMEFGFGYHAWDVTQNAAREGARVGAVDPSVTDIEARVRGTSNVLNQSLLDVTVQCQPAAGGSFTSCGTWAEGDIVRVTVVYQYDYITPLPHFVSLGDSMTLTSVSEARFEGQ